MRHTIAAMQVVAAALLMLNGCGYSKSSYSNSNSPGEATPVNDTPLLASAVIDDTPGLLVPSDFVGLSHEWGVAEELAGSKQAGRNLLYRQLLSNLLQYSDKPIILRIGGNSTDRTNSIEEADLEPFNDLESDLGGRLRFTFGINMGADDPSLADAEMASILSVVPAASVLGLELGNEPDSYVAKHLRPSGYTFSDYMVQLKAWRVLVTSRSALSWVSPALATFTWIEDFEQALSSDDAPPQLVTQHYYPGAYQQAEPKSADFLLEDRNATAGPIQMEPYIAAAHASHKQLRIGELNSLSNGGQPGVSDSFSAALWGLDIMFEFAKAGADGVNWHTGNGGAYDLFQFKRATAKASLLNIYSLVQVRPLFYGLQLFEEAATANGRFLPVSIKTAANLKIWALQGDDCRIRIVIINKDQAHAGTIQLAINGFSNASVSRLLAPTLSSQTQVTLGGQTYDGSVDGSLRGRMVKESLVAVNGAFTLNMPTVSAALIMLSNQ